MHLRIDSHSGFAKDPATPARDSSPVVPSGYADCPCNLNYETPGHSRSKRPLYVLLNDNPRLSRISDNNRMHVDPHISQPSECRTNPFATFVLPHPISIDLFDTSEPKHSPPGEPNAKKPLLHGYGHTLTQIPDPVPKQLFLQRQRPYSFHNQISFDS
jgi:hypothetical protein